jgi:hypothetical protein
MSKIFPDGKMEQDGTEESGGETQGHNREGDKRVKEKQAKKYLEGEGSMSEDEEMERKQKPVSTAWVSPRDKDEEKSDKATVDPRSDDEKKDRHRHHHHHRSGDRDRQDEDGHHKRHHRHHRDEDQKKHRHHHHSKRKDGSENSDSDHSSSRTKDNTKEKSKEKGEDLEAGPELEPELEPGRLEKTQSYVEAVDLLFRKTKQDIDALSQYMPAHEDDDVLLTITEILFKPYSKTLKTFAYLFWICQFATLIALFWSMLPCPDQKIDWSVVIALPLCCGYGLPPFPICLLSVFCLISWSEGGIESFHDMLRFIHLRKTFPVLVLMIVLNGLLQLLCIGVVMGKSVGLLDLVGNFIGSPSSLPSSITDFPPSPPSSSSSFRRSDHPAGG